MNHPWKNLIAHVDMDAFFASIEQHRHPELANQPVVITSNANSNTVIAASYEAKALGVTVGAAVPSLPELNIIHSTLKDYLPISKTIMGILADLCPQIEVYSIDEAYLDLSGMSHIYENEITMIHHIQKAIFAKTGLRCSVGLAENKVLAKVASKENKPNGHFIVPPGEGLTYLKDKPIGALCGIGPKVQQFLNQHQVYRCKDITKIPISILSAKFGIRGQQVWHMCQGRGTSQLSKPKQHPKSMGHSKCIEPKNYSAQEIQHIFDQLCHRLCIRLRNESLYAQNISLTIKGKQTMLKYSYKTPTASQYQNDMQHSYKAFIKSLSWPRYVRQVSIRVINIHPIKQLDFLTSNNDTHEDIIDDINLKYGEHTIQYAREIQTLKD